MFPQGLPVAPVAGSVAPAEREDLGAAMAGGGDATTDGGGYEYEVKRQRLLQGGSAAASGMFASYYQTPHQPQPQQNHQPPFTSASAGALQSSIAASLNSYFAATSATQQPLTQQGSVPTPTSGLYTSYEPHPTSAAAPAAGPPPPNSSFNPSGHYSSPGMNSHYMRNPVSNANSAVTKPTNNISSSQHTMNPSSANMKANPSSANTNVNFTNDGRRNPNYFSSAPYPNSGHMAPFASAGLYPPTVSSAPLSSSLSPYRVGASPALPGLHHPGASPPAPPLPMMPFERRSPHLARSPAMVPPPFFNGPGFPPFRSFARVFPVVRLRGLPFNCTESDIYEFFRGLDVVDVLLTHKQGRFSGEGYCVFGLPMQVDLALQRNRQSMGQRYIEVFRSKKHEYYMAVAAEVEEGDKPGPREEPPSLASSRSADKVHMEHTGVLKLRGLPFSASKRDVIEFFKDFDLKDENIQFVVHSDGRATGEAYVEFEGPSQSKQAMSRDKMMLGSRYVELFPSSSEEAARATGRFKK